MEKLAPFQRVMIQGVSDLAAAELWVVCKATPVVTRHLSLTG